MKSSCVVIPIYTSILDKKEEISLSSCLNTLSKHPIIFATYKSLDISNFESIASKHKQEFKVEYFPESYFQSIQGYNKLLTSIEFYKRFVKFDFLLIFQLDAFVFKDELENWAEKGYDYIGAPWKEGWASAHIDAPFQGVGNGGFSLRKIQSHLRVLRSFSYIEGPRLLAGRWLKLSLSGKLGAFPGVFAKLTFRNNTFHLFNDYRGNEDVFWGYHATRNFKWFNVAPIEEAIKFSFETHPKSLFFKNQEKLPFGCHGWWKYDLDFWKPHIQKQGYLI